MQAKLVNSRRRGHVPFPCECRGITPEAVPPVRVARGSDPPEWARHAVWYQIMPDRFRNGNPHNDPDPVRPWTSAWFSQSPWERQAGRGFYKSAYHRHYGGDLDGLAAKLPYLADLGINALYLNPLFKAASFHKYNATDYVHIDDHFGTKGDYEAVAATEDLLDPDTWRWTDSDRRFLRFLENAHALGFRVIIDGVFNHVGTQHRAFRDVQTNGPDSRYADWFEVSSWQPFEYRGWWDRPELPVFKKNATGLACEAVKAHIFAITRRWMAPEGDPRAGVDGWRLDVPSEIAPPFWAEWRELVKSINPQAYISGEIWGRADRWLDGRHFDAVMNYPFARAVVAWVFNRRWKITVSELDRRLRGLRLAYPAAVSPVMQNLLDSHDTDRVASMAHNPDRRYNKRNRPQDEGVTYDDGKPPAEAYARARLAALIQVTYVGAPMIYYGDEVGMWGAADPTCRKPMLWEDLEPYERPEENHVMRDQLEFYRRTIALRRQHSALRTGSFRTLLCDDDADVWAFQRRSADELVVVALNASNEVQQVHVPLPLGSPAKWKAVFGPEAEVAAQADKLTLRVPAIGGIVLRSAVP